MKFKSKYKRLSFTVNGQRLKFDEGVFETEDKAVIEVLERLADVTAVAEKKAAPVKAAPAKKAGTAAQAPKK